MRTAKFVIVKKESHWTGLLESDGLSLFVFTEPESEEAAIEKAREVIKNIKIVIQTTTETPAE